MFMLIELAEPWLCRAGALQLEGASGGAKPCSSCPQLPNPAVRGAAGSECLVICKEGVHWGSRAFGEGGRMMGWAVTQTPLQPSATIPGDTWSVRARGRDTCGEGPGEGFGVGAVA